MAYNNPTLADILSALAAEGAAQRQTPTQQTPQQFYTGPLYDDEDEGYYPSYYRPDPYAASGFFGPQFGRSRFTPLRRQQQEEVVREAQQEKLRRQARAAAQAALSAQPDRDSDDNKQPSIDLFDLLSQLVGVPVANPESVEEEQGVKESEEEPKQVEAGSSSEAEKKQPSKPEVTEPPKPQSKPQSSKPSLRRHSSHAASHAAPSPKVEISQRNTTIPSLPYTPQSNVYNTEKEYIAVLAIPGASLKDLDIDFHPSSNEIVVTGTIPDPIDTFINGSENEKEKYNLKVSEVRTGSIERRFKFPNLPKIDENAIKAKYVNGMLSIRIPKVEEELKPKIRKVTIEEVPDEELIYEETGGLGKK